MSKQQAAKVTALAVAGKAAAVTPEQLVLIKQTIAAGATDAELQLFLFDCARQGTHPLDRLIHFTVRTDKRGVRRYTPITSIDFMRIRAAETGEYAGSDDAVFTYSGNKMPDTATTTVWRLVGGMRCPFTASARWAEYKPQDDFMWLKMPHTLLGKCSEALALRKGFPRQLQGLYAKEEMAQAGDDVSYQIHEPDPVPRAMPARREQVPVVEPEALAPIEPAPQSFHHAASGEVITAPQVKRLKTILANSGRTAAEVKGWMKRRYGLDSSTEITRNLYDEVVSAIEAPGDLPERVGP